MRKVLNLSWLTLLVVAFGCEKQEIEVAPFKPVVFKETFDTESNDFMEDTYLSYGAWTSFAETGTIKWTEQDDDDNGYLQFSTFGLAKEDSNIAWAITPKINLDNSENEVLNFKTSKKFVSNNLDNKMEIYISTDFDGKDVLKAKWTLLPAIVAGTNLTTGLGDGVIKTESGDIDLSNYKGDVYIGFKAYGSKTLTGSLRFDDVVIYDKTLK